MTSQLLTFKERLPKEKQKKTFNRIWAVLAIGLTLTNIILFSNVL